MSFDVVYGPSFKIDSQIAFAIEIGMETFFKSGNSWPTNKSFINYKITIYIILQKSFIRVFCQFSINCD